MLGRVLVIGGSDSGGGAGVQADIKTVTVLGAFATSAITSITVQNTRGVRGVHHVPVATVRAQIDAVLEDIGTDAIKTGMLGSAAITAAVANAIAAFSSDRRPALVVDPVMIAKGGASLLEDDAVAVLRKELLPLAAVVTPNAPEAELLTGVKIRDVRGQIEAARALVAMGARAAVVKGGHVAPGENEPTIELSIDDVLLERDGEPIVFRHARVVSTSTHGTGCTLASAIATFLARGLSLRDAVERARRYVREAIIAAPRLGGGHGPMHHGWPIPTDADLIAR
ncbi:MAG: bifunctional hydroxymethylpyrimidine kinase/phosphomethylpyrimidine kinase [Polyangiaceae bacterium]